MLRVGPGGELPMMPEEPAAPDLSAAVAEPMMESGAEGMGGMVDPTVARYLGPNDRCGACVHFMEGARSSSDLNSTASNTGTCEIVAGPIDPMGVCSLFTPDIESVEEPVENVPTEMTEEAPEGEVY
jgi:hypothetical protein